MTEHELLLNTIIALLTIGATLGIVFGTIWAFAVGAAKRPGLWIAVAIIAFLYSWYS